MTTLQIEQPETPPRWSLDYDPRDALYPTGAVNLTDDEVPLYIAKQFKREAEWARRNVATAAAFSGRPIALKKVLELGWPVVSTTQCGHIDDLMSLVLHNCHNTPEGICEMIDMLVAHNASVTVQFAKPYGDWTTPVGYCDYFIKHLERKPRENTQKIKTLQAARARLIHHGASPDKK